MFEFHAMNLQLQDLLSKPQSLSTIPAIENVAEVTNKFQVEPATREPLQTKPTSQNKTSLPPFDPPNFVAPQMEERITLNSPQNFSLEGEQIAEVNFAAIQRAENKVESRIRWEVCLDKENYSDDDIVLCEMWLWAVHQSCYGRELRGGVPDDNLFWERCRFLRTEGKISENKLKEVKCEFCSDVKGWIIHKKPFGWWHISWVNLIQGLYFKEDKKRLRLSEKSIKVATESSASSEIRKKAFESNVISRAALLAFMSAVLQKTILLQSGMKWMNSKILMMEI